MIGPNKLNIEPTCCGGDPQEPRPDHDKEQTQGEFLAEAMKHWVLTLTAAHQMRASGKLSNQEFQAIAKEEGGKLAAVFDESFTDMIPRTIDDLV